MIQPRQPDESEAANDPPGTDHCSLLDNYWDALRDESGLELGRFIDQDLSDASIAGDLDVLNVLHQVRSAARADGEASGFPTAFLSESLRVEASTRLGQTGAGAPPPRGEGPKAPEMPERIGKYHVVEMLDQGGQAQVFRVIHPQLANEYVLKLARRPMAVQDQAGRDALLREGRILAQCEHPNLVRVIDLDVHEGRRFVVMDYVKGQTLKQLVAQGLPGPRRAARIVIELARAVAYLDRSGITHQDIKPNNVLVDDQDRPRLLDFGLARQDDAWRDDADDWTGGTAGFMSPEQALGCANEIGPRTDVFGLGALLYYLLTGRPLYVGSSRAATFRLARNADTIPVRQLHPLVPRSLERICEKALAADPEQRYATAIELEGALRRSLERRWVAAAASLIVLSLIGAVLFAMRPWPTVAPKILAFQVDAFRGESAEPLGRIGLYDRTIQFDDDVRVSGRLDAPAYSYLIALNTNGDVQLCDPPTATAPRARSTSIRYPTDSTRYFGLNDGTGVQAFVLLAVTRPLPAFDQWEGREGLKQRWKPDLTDGVWSYDGHWIKRVDSGHRGDVRERVGHPLAFQAVCDYLKKRRDVEAIRGIAFPVQPKK